MFLRQILARSLPFVKFVSRFSTQKLTDILRKVQVHNEQNEPISLLDSGIVVSHNVDSTTKKITMALNLTKDYRKVKALLKGQLEAEGYTDVDI